jgi:tryptophan 2,3-dioxygenase
MTRSVAKLSKDPMPRYYSYTDVHLLDWYLGRQHDTFKRLRTRALRGICLLLRDLVRFEADTLAGMETLHASSLDYAWIVKRIEAVRPTFQQALALLPAETLSDTHWLDAPQHHDAIEGYALEPDRVSALVHFSCMPQTKYHDEVLFLRSIHISEFCFYAIRLSLVEAIENRSHPDTQRDALEDAVGFSAILHLVFKILRTMPVEHFRDFRDATGNASAVQSHNYQRMEIYLRGLSPQKKEIFLKDPFLRELASFGHPEFVHLGGVLRNAPEREGAPPEVMDAARRLDRKLLAWRGLHLAFAKGYLEPHMVGTGATSGAPYLERFLKQGLFEDTPFDASVIDEMFADMPTIPEMFSKMSASSGISPAFQKATAGTA